MRDQKQRNVFGLISAVVFKPRDLRLKGAAAEDLAPWRRVPRAGNSLTDGWTGHCGPMGDLFLRRVLGSWSSAALPCPWSRPYQFPATISFPSSARRIA